MGKGLFTRACLRGMIVPSLAACLTGPLSARAEINALQTAAKVTSGAMLPVAAIDVVSATKDCACMANPAAPKPCVPMVAWGPCPTLPLGIGAAAGFAAAMGANDKAAGTTASHNGAGGSDYKSWLNDPKIDPDVKDALKFGSNAPGLKEGIKTYREMLSKGDIPPPEGMTADEALAKLDEGVSTLDNAVNRMREELEADEASGSAFANAAGGGGKSGNGFYDGGGDSWGGFSFAGSGGKVGPSDRSGLGAARAFGSLELIDEESGKSLTLWQRATRKYQGEDGGKRAFILAKMEFIRSQALKQQQMKLAAKSPAQKSKTEPPAVKAASRSPAGDKDITIKPVNFVPQKH